MLCILLLTQQSWSDKMVEHIRNVRDRKNGVQDESTPTVKKAKKQTVVESLSINICIGREFS